MEQFTEMLTQYATKEVLTVIAALGVAWGGWKAASKTMGLVSTFAQKASFMGITAGVLLLVGLGVTGLGVGELASRGSGPAADEITQAALIEEASKPGFKNDQLLTLLTSDNNVSTELTREILDYARNRDGQLPDQKLLELTENNPEAITALIELMKAREDRIAKQYEYARTQHADSVKSMTANLDEPVYFVPYDEYTKTSDNKSEFNLVEADETTIGNADSLMSVPMAWLSILLGLGGTISGVTCFMCRNNKRNSEDPHHPTRFTV